LSGGERVSGVVRALVGRSAGGAGGGGFVLAHQQRAPRAHQVAVRPVACLVVGPLAAREHGGNELPFPRHAAVEPGRGARLSVGRPRARAAGGGGGGAVVGRDAAVLLPCPPRVLRRARGDDVDAGGVLLLARGG